MMTLRPLTIACLLALGAVTGAAGPDPASAGSEPSQPPPDVPCVLDHDSASRAVTDAYADLARVYRTRVPGPSGESLLRKRVDAFLDRVVDVDAFVRNVLRGVWQLATPEQRLDWRVAMDRMLRNRYLRGFEGPNQHILAIQRSDVSCRTASVRVALSQPGHNDPRLVDIDLIHDGGEWRVYDVSLDGVSLARTWRSRFLRIYKEGGLAGVDSQMRLLGARYRVNPDADADER